MSNTLYLTKPTVELEEEYLTFYHEWLKSGENMVPWVIEKDPSDFEGMIQFLTNSEEGIEIPDGWVRHSTYWLANEKKKF